MGIIILFRYFAVIVALFFVSALNMKAKWNLFEKAGVKGSDSIIPIRSYVRYTQIATGKRHFAYIFIILCVYLFIIAPVALLFAYNISSEYADILRYSIILSMTGVCIPLLIVSGYVNYMFGKAFGMQKIWNQAMILFSFPLITLMGLNENIRYVGVNGVPDNCT